MLSGSIHAVDIERSCAVIASALSDGRCKGVRLVSGDRRELGMNTRRSEVHIPYPALTLDWTPRTWTCGVAMSCAPSKGRLAPFALRALSPRETTALSIVEGGVALGWVGSRWPGLVPQPARAHRELVST